MQMILFGLLDVGLIGAAAAAAAAAVVVKHMIRFYYCYSNENIPTTLLVRGRFLS